MIVFTYSPIIPADYKSRRRHFLTKCLLRRHFFMFDWDYKPGSVIDSHLSRRSVAAALKPPPRKRPGRPYASSTVLHRIEFTAPQCSHAAGELLPRLSTLTPRAGRYFSVALFLKSPSAGVTRYPCPVEPGLSSRPAFRPGRATVCLTRLSILAESDGIVNAWPQCGLHIGGSRQGLPLKIPDGPQSAARSRLHGPAALGEKVWEGEGRGCIFFRSAV